MVADVPVTTGPGPGLGVRDADGSPRRESRTSSRVVEPGLGLFRRRAAVAIASSVSLWPDPNRFHAGVKKETETSASSSWPRTFVRFPTRVDRVVLSNRVSRSFAFASCGCRPFRCCVPSSNDRVDRSRHALPLLRVNTTPTP